MLFKCYKRLSNYWFSPSLLQQYLRQQNANVSNNIAPSFSYCSQNISIRRFFLTRSNPTMTREQQPGEGHIAGSDVAISTSRGNGTSYRSRNGDNGTTAATPGTATDRILGRGKFTLAIDCDGLLMPDANRPGIFTSKSAEDAAQSFHLSTLLTVHTLYKIKIKCFHTCGPIEFDEGSCLRTLTSMGDWLVNHYRGMERSARYETWTNGRGGEWSDPDMVLIIRVE
ncbi:hypothetical protein PMIN03_012394 [Paraphaeosphaeria minitans]